MKFAFEQASLPDSIRVSDKRRDEEYSSYEINAPFLGDTGVEVVEYLPEQRRQTKTPNVIEAHLGVLLGQSAQI